MKTEEEDNRQTESPDTQGEAPKVIDFSQDDAPDEGGGDITPETEIDKEKIDNGVLDSLEGFADEDDFPWETDIQPADIPPYLRAFRTYLRSAVVLNRVYPIEIEHEGTHYKHVSFHGLDWTEKSVSHFLPKGSPAPMVPMFAVRLHREKPVASLDTMRLNTLKASMFASDEDQDKGKMLTIARQPYERQLNLAFEHGLDNSIRLLDTQLSEDMVNKFFESFDKFLNMAENDGCVLVHLTSDGIAEVKTGSRLTCEAEMVRLRNDCYSPDNPYIREVRDFLADAVDNYMGFVASYHDNTVATCFVMTMADTFAKPINDTTQYKRMLRSIDPSLVKRMDNLKEVSIPTKCENGVTRPLSPNFRK